MEDEIKKQKFQKIFRAALILINGGIFGLLCFALYSGADYSIGQKENSYLIGASYMTMNNEFYKIVSEEISARVEAEGDCLVVRDPALDAKRQITQIDDMLKMGIDVLVVTPVDFGSLADVLKRAKEQGVKIIVADTDLADQELADCTIRSDNYRAGELVGEYFLKQNETARLVIMVHESAKSGQDRVNGFLDTVEGQNGMEIVKKIECEGQTEIAMPKLQEAIRQGTVFDNVFCLNDLASVGVVAALENNHMEEVGVYGVDASPDAKALIKEGMMQASATQFPSQIGKKTADVIYALLQGETVEREILIPVELITQENAESFGTDRWQ